MKKRKIIIIGMFLMITPIVAYASTSIWAQRMDCTLKADGNVLNNMQVYNIQGDAYVPIRPFCENFGMNVNWKYDSEYGCHLIDILTDEEPGTDLDYEDIGYKVKISKDAASNIADALFLQKYGENFTKDNEIKVVDESSEDNCYIIHRHNSKENYKDYSIKISKVNGEVLAITEK